MQKIHDEQTIIIRLIFFSSIASDVTMAQHCAEQVSCWTIRF